MRFWALPSFDPSLDDWLQAVDPSAPSARAAREFAWQSKEWDLEPPDLVTKHWLEPNDVVWNERNNAGWLRIKSEIGQLQQLMQDDRERYLDEIDAQADGLPGYMLAFIGASPQRHPWTYELVACALAISDVAYMRWKSRFARVRPSTLCPGLVPNFGPPAHPSFPSGHATAGHLIALLLLEIPELQRRFGIFAPAAPRGGPVPVPPPVPSPPPNPLAGELPLPSPLLWLAARMAKNRERLGVHYASDSFAGRHLAAALWRALLHANQGGVPAIDSPTLRNALARAKAEWV